MMQQRVIFKNAMRGLLALGVFVFVAPQANAQSAKMFHDEERGLRRENKAAEQILATYPQDSTSYREANASLPRLQSALGIAQRTGDRAMVAEQVQARPPRVGGGGGTANGYGYQDWREEPLRNVPEWDLKTLQRVKAEQARAALERARRDEYEARYNTGVANTGSNAAAAPAVASEARGSRGAHAPEDVSSLFRTLKVQASNLDATLLDNIFPGEFKVSKKLTLRTESAKRQYLMQQMDTLLAEISSSGSDKEKVDSLTKSVAKNEWFGRYVQSFLAREAMFNANQAKNSISPAEGLEKVKKMAGNRSTLSAALGRAVNGVTQARRSNAKDSVVALLLGAALSSAAQAGEAEAVGADDASAASSLAAADRAAFRPQARVRRGGVSN